MNAKTKGFVTAIGISTFLLCATITFAQNGNVIKASSTYKTQEVKIGNFDQIKLQGSPTIVYTQTKNKKAELKIVGSDNLLDLLECEVVNNVLSVRFKQGVSVQFGTGGRLKIEASSPSIESVHVQGSGDVILMSELRCTDLKLSLQGSGDIKAGAIICTNGFTASLQGSGDITVENRLQAESAVLRLQGSGDLDVNGLKAESATAFLQGSGDLKARGVSVGGKVQVELAGSGDLNFQGIRANEVVAKLQGSGDMKLVGATQQATLTLSSSGSIDAKELRATDVDARLQGSGDISCSVSGTLNTNTSGSGQIRYKGTPSKIESTGKNKPRKL